MASLPIMVLRLSRVVTASLSSLTARRTFSLLTSHSCRSRSADLPDHKAPRATKESLEHKVFPVSKAIRATPAPPAYKVPREIPDLRDPKALAAGESR